LSHVLDWLIRSVLLIAFLAFCVGCMAAPLWIVARIPLPDVVAPLAHLVAGIAGLWFALWVGAKVTGSRF